MTTRITRDDQPPLDTTLVEHGSLYHAWIQGALESGIRVAQAIHETSAVAI
jgi:monoamine oxidase